MRRQIHCIHSEVFSLYQSLALNFLFACVLLPLFMFSASHCPHHCLWVVALKWFSTYSLSPSYLCVFTYTHRLSWWTQNQREAANIFLFLWVRHTLSHTPWLSYLRIAAGVKEDQRVVMLPLLPLRRRDNHILRKQRWRISLLLAIFISLCPLLHLSLSFRLSARPHNAIHLFSSPSNCSPLFLLLFKKKNQIK